MMRPIPLLGLAFSGSLVGGCLGSAAMPPEPTPHAQAKNATGGGSAGAGAVADAGDDEGATTPPTPQGAMTLTLDKTTDTIRLNESKTYSVTLTPSGGLTGNVSLALVNAPTGVSGVFTPATINITDATPATAELNVTVASDAVSAAASLDVKATAGAISAETHLAANIPAELLLTIAKGVSLGTAAAPDLTAFSGVSKITAHYVPGLKITWVNNDSIDHEIHAQNSANMLGVAHEGGPLLPASSYTQTITGTGTIKADDTRCHIHSTMVGPEIDIIP